MRKNVRPDGCAVYSDWHATQIRKRLGNKIDSRQAKCRNYDKSSDNPYAPLPSAPLATVTKQINSQSNTQQSHHRSKASDDPPLPLTGRRELLGPRGEKDSAIRHPHEESEDVVCVPVLEAEVIPRALDLVLTTVGKIVVDQRRVEAPDDGA